MESSDQPKFRISEKVTLKKFGAKPDGSEWTPEEMDSGAADDALLEVITLLDGVVVDVWKR